MNWPPVKAWTSNINIEGQFHFVAINYGGKDLDRWVILMSVLDSRLVIKVSWDQLDDSVNWEPGWVEDNYSKSPKLVNIRSDKRTIINTYPSNDSGLTIPITKDFVRPWFDDT